VLETPHVIIGAAIATKVQNPLLSLPLALGSHFLLEKIPHWNPHLNTEKHKYGKITKQSTIIVLADSTLALGSGLLIALQKMPNLGSVAVVLAACLLSILPDLIEAPYFFLGIDNPYIVRWIKFQKSIQTDAKPFWGLTAQLATIALGFWWILN
jgi:hypothetical protein